MRLLAIIIVTLLSGGCSTVTLKNFDKSEYSISSDNVLTVLYSKHEGDKVNFVGGTSNNADSDLTLKISNELKSSITDKCGVLNDYTGDGRGDSDKSLTAALVPIVAALGKFIFDQSVDNANRELEKIKKAAIRSYSSRSIIPSDLLRDSKCILLVRGGPENINTKVSDKAINSNIDVNKSGMVVLLVKQDYGDAFTYRPVYVNVKNTVALTKAGTFEKNNDDPSKVCQNNKNEKDKCAKASIAVAMSLKAINAQGGPRPKLISFGEAVTSIPSVEMKQDNANSCVKIINDDEKKIDVEVEICHETDLIPYPITKSHHNADFVSLTIAVTETGVVGFDIDQAISENKAIKEALGPAISDSLKELLAEDD